MARKSRKNVMLQENTAIPDKEKKVLFKAGLYARLSHEKEENIERGTIETQMELMKNYVKDHEDIVIEEEYYDASFTGTNFERPDFKRMLEDAKTGRINCIIVKDLSRLGRNYVEMGNYIERVFPFLNVRFIAVENTHEPLVDKETFEKAQERVKEISDAYFAKEFTKHPPNEKNLLKGKIVCGDCGKGMRLSPRTTKSYVYFCGTFSDGINPACSRHKIDQEDVNKAVFAQISNHMRCCIDALRVIRELNARSSGMKKYDVYEKAITRQRRELEKVNRKFSELYGDYSEHLINESEYLTLKQQYLLKSEALKKEIDNLLVSQNLYSKNYKIDEDWENLINKYLKCRKLNKELADAFVDKVQVFEDGRISVNLVYDDCLEELLQVKNKREGDLYE